MWAVREGARLRHFWVVCGHRGWKAQPDGASSGPTESLRFCGKARTTCRRLKPIRKQRSSYSRELIIEATQSTPRPPRLAILHPPFAIRFREFRPPLRRLGGVARTRFRGVRGVVEVDKRLDHLDRPLVFRAFGGFEDRVCFQQGRLRFCPVLFLRWRLAPVRYEMPGFADASSRSSVESSGSSTARVYEPPPAASSPRNQTSSFS